MPLLELNFLVNRLFGVIALLGLRLTAHLHISVDNVHAQGLLIKSQNEELAAANMEVIRHKAEIARQNAELEESR